MVLLEDLLHSCGIPQTWIDCLLSIVFDGWWVEIVCNGWLGRCPTGGVAGAGGRHKAGEGPVRILVGAEKLSPRPISKYHLGLYFEDYISYHFLCLWKVITFDDKSPQRSPWSWSWALLDSIRRNVEQRSFNWSILGRCRCCLLALIHRLVDRMLQCKIARMQQINHATNATG